MFFCWVQINREMALPILAFVGLQGNKLIKEREHMLEIILLVVFLLLAFVFCAFWAFLEINKDEIWESISLKDDNEDNDNE